MSATLQIDPSALRQVSAQQQRQQLQLDQQSEALERQNMQMAAMAVQAVANNEALAHAQRRAEASAVQLQQLEGRVSAVEANNKALKVAVVVLSVVVVVMLLCIFL